MRIFKIEKDRDGVELGQPYVISCTTSGGKSSFVTMTVDELRDIRNQINEIIKD